MCWGFQYKIGSKEWMEIENGKDLKELCNRLQIDVPVIEDNGCLCPLNEEDQIRILGHLILNSSARYEKIEIDWL